MIPATPTRTTSNVPVARNEQGGDKDRGSVLPMVLVLSAVGAITVAALLSFAIALFKTQPKLAERDDTFHSARSAMEMAIVLQRAQGPDACFTNTAPSTLAINSMTASVSCSTAGGYFGTAQNRLGVITTSPDAATAYTGAGTANAQGEVFVTGQDPADSRLWPDLVGPDPEHNGTHHYPTLPPVPAYVRGTVNPASIGNCKLLFPGRYIEPVVLDDGRYYLSSGVYYFEESVTITGGASVVAGQGRFEGCAGGDAIAAGHRAAPTNPTITGRGATFLLGNDARLVVDGARLTMNRRVSDATTRGTDGVSIRTINFGTDPADPAGALMPTIPADVVYVGPTYAADNSSCDASVSTEFCLQGVADHEIVLSVGATASRYTSSTLTSADSALSISQPAGAASNGVEIDGMILTPNAGLVVADDADAAHQVRILGSVVAATVELGAKPGADYVVGIVDQAIQQRFSMNVEVTSPSGVSATSHAVVDVHLNGQYAINAWSVDAGV